MSKVLSSLLAIAALAATAAQATPIRLDGTETNLQQIVNNMAIDGSSSVNVVTDQYALDQAWTINSLDSVGTGLIMMELAGYAGSNRFGIYDIANTSTRLQLFSGADATGALARFEIDGSGHVSRNFIDSGLIFSSSLFGFYLETPDGLWLSQSELNADGADHMVAYRGEGETIRTPRSNAANWGSDLYLLGWEDLSSNRWDQDYNDFVVLVGGVQGVSVPEPATLGLLGFGLAGLGVFGRRRKV